MASEELVTDESRPLYTFKTDLKRNALYQHATSVLAKLSNASSNALDDIQLLSSGEVIERALNLKPSAFASKGKISKMNPFSGLISANSHRLFIADNPIIVYGDHWPEIDQAPCPGRWMLSALPSFSHTRPSFMKLILLQNSVRCSRIFLIFKENG
jgi:hypothetical protein